MLHLYYTRFILSNQIKNGVGKLKPFKILIDFCNLGFINKIFYKLMRTKFSALFIPIYKKSYKIDESIIVDDKFDSLEDFFTRKIDMTKRPEGAGKYISPCDGFISAAGKLSEDKTFKVKGHIVDTLSLTGDSESYEYYQVIYLSPSDYHRFHAIDENEFVSSKTIGKKSIPVNDKGFKIGNPFLKNYRIILKSKDYAYIPVGATNVNSIEIKKRKFLKGEEIGQFGFGSTIVILYKETPGTSKFGKIKVREDLFA